MNIESMRNTLIITGTCRRDLEKADDWTIGIVAAALALGLWMVCSAILGG